MASIIQADTVEMIIASGPTRQRGRRLTTWTNYDITEDLFVAGNHFSFELSMTGEGSDVPPDEYLDLACELTQPDAVVRLEMGGQLLFTGIIEMQWIGDAEGGEQKLEVSGLDGALPLLSNEVDPKLDVSGDITLPGIADKILAPYRGKGISFEVIADDQANRSLLTGKRISSAKTINTSRGPATISRYTSSSAPPNFTKQTMAEAKPHPAETEWDFLHRHAENIGVIPYFTAAGDLAFIYPDYDQEPMFDFVRRKTPGGVGNIMYGGQRRNHAGTATSVHVLGRGSLYRREAPSTSTKSGISSSISKRPKKVKPKLSAIARTDRPFTWRRDRYLRDANPISNAEAQRVANRELAHRNANAKAWQYTMADHMDARGFHYTVNVMANLRDDVIRPNGINEPVWLTQRRITRSFRPDSFSTTHLRMVPKGSIVL